MQASVTRSNIQAAGASLTNRTASRTNPGEDNMGKADFMNLLMAQMTHQDPLNPMDSTGMMNQLTQMGSMEQMINLNKQVGQLNTTQSDIARFNAYSFLDRDVSITGGKVTVQAGRPHAAQFRLQQEAEAVSVTITDLNGNPVRHLELGQNQAGSHRLEWDGLDNNGDPVGDGTYLYNISATSPGGQAISAELLVQGRVGGVSFRDGRPMVQVNDQWFDINDVEEVTNSSANLFNPLSPKPMATQLNPMPVKPLDE